MLTPQGMAVAGEQLLGAGEVFTIRPLQLYAVTEQLQQGKPTCASGDAKTDLGHILDFTCRLKYLKVKLQQLSVGKVDMQQHGALQITGWHCVQEAVWASGEGRKATLGVLGTVLLAVSTRGQS